MLGMISWYGVEAASLATDNPRKSRHFRVDHSNISILIAEILSGLFLTSGLSVLSEGPSRPARPEVVHFLSQSSLCPDQYLVICYRIIYSQEMKV